MAQLPDGTLIGGIAFDTDAIIGAGGWVTRFDAADDGTMVCGSDACGPRIRRLNDNKWSKLFVPGRNIAISSIYRGAAGPTYDVAIAASDSDVVYWITGTSLWKTTDGGDTVTSLILGIDGPGNSENTNPNELNRMTSKPLAVDPVNPDVVIFGTRAGLRYSDDGGGTQTSISTGDVPTPAFGPSWAWPSDISSVVGRYTIAFDRSSPVVGGKTQGIYVFAPQAIETDSGVYHTTDGGATWANVPGGPAMAGSMEVSPHDGSVHLAGNSWVGDTNEQYHRWNGSSWIAPSGVSAKSIAISPHNAGHVYLAQSGSSMAVSTNNGAAWSAFAGSTRKAINIPWHELCNEVYMSNGRIIFDLARNRLWLGEGIGAWYIDNPTTVGGSMQWYEASAGIENMVSNLMACDGNGRLLYTCHDRRGFTIDRDKIANGYPPMHVNAAPTQSIVHGGNISYNPSNYDHLAIAIWSYQGASSFDGGKTWSDPPGWIGTFSAGVGGGNIEMLSDLVWIQRESNNGKIMWTKDGGETWTKLIIGSDVEFYGAYINYYVSHRPMIRDKYVPNRVWLYLVGYGDDSDTDVAQRGLWRLDYNTITEAWTTTRVKGPSSPYIINFNVDFWHGKLVQIAVDDFLWCGGDAADGLWRSTDGMATWAQLTGTDDVHTGSQPFGYVYGVAVGAGKEPGDKTIFACGFRGSPYDPVSYEDFGYWLSEDLGETWTRLAQLLDGNTSTPNDVAADPEEYGRFYVGHGSEGVSRMRYQDKRNWAIPG